jgi:hypothetical protein
LGKLLAIIKESYMILKLIFLPSCGIARKALKYFFRILEALSHS